MPRRRTDEYYTNQHCNVKQEYDIWICLLLTVAEQVKSSDIEQQPPIGERI